MYEKIVVTSPDFAYREDLEKKIREKAWRTWKN
jgi:hypothetical protein